MLRLFHLLRDHSQYLAQQNDLGCLWTLHYVGHRQYSDDIYQLRAQPALDSDCKSMLEYGMKCDSYTPMRPPTSLVSTLGLHHCYPLRH